MHTDSKTQDVLMAPQRANVPHGSSLSPQVRRIIGERAVPSSKVTHTLSQYKKSRPAWKHRVAARRLRLPQVDQRDVMYGAARVHFCEGTVHKVRMEGRLNRQ